MASLGTRGLVVPRSKVGGQSAVVGSVVMSCQASGVFLDSCCSTGLGLTSLGCSGPSDEHLTGLLLHSLIDFWLLNLAFILIADISGHPGISHCHESLACSRTFLPEKSLATCLAAFFLPLFSDGQNYSFCSFQADFILCVETVPPVRERALTSLNNGPHTCFISWHLISCSRRQFSKLSHNNNKKITLRLFPFRQRNLNPFFVHVFYQTRGPVT